MQATVEVSPLGKAYPYRSPAPPSGALCFAHTSCHFNQTLPSHGINWNLSAAGIQSSAIKNALIGNYATVSEAN